MFILINQFSIFFDFGMFFCLANLGKKLVIRFFFGMVLPIAPLRSDRHGSFTYSTGLARKALSLPIFFRVRWATPWMPRQGENWGFRVCTKKSEKSIQKLEWWGKGCQHKTRLLRIFGGFCYRMQEWISSAHWKCLFLLLTNEDNGMGMKTFFVAQRPKRGQKPWKSFAFITSFH